MHPLWLRQGRGVAVHLPVLIPITLSFSVCMWVCEIFCQDLVIVPAGCCLHTFPAFTTACKSDCQRNQKDFQLKRKMFLSFQWLQTKQNFSCELYLEGELLVEYRIEGLPVNLSLKLLLLVGQQVDLYIRVRCAAHVHSRQLCSLDDPHYELDEKEEEQKVESRCVSCAC